MTPELLSPAGNFESLKMAVYAGATAVYFGAKNFNARAKADNFGENLKNAVAFAHMFGTKVYLTLNTIIENNEIEELYKTISNAIESNVDAFIVQDFGVLNILKNHFPQAEIHASTQMAVNNYKGAIMAEQMGIKRVVLSRETSLEDIKLIKQKTNLEIEYFIQGALCVCFSGNCYMSSYLFSKSGNRGECMQPCRLPIKAFLKGKQIANGYLFSAKDINMSNRLKDLVNAGVDSFKIEGRLRRPAYVYAVTKTYKKILENNFKATEQDQTVLKKSFNRGDFTQGYLNGNGNIIDSNIQGHKGIKIGKVVGFKKGKKFNVLSIKANCLHKGDSIKIINNNVEQATITAMDLKENNGVFEITTTAHLQPVGDVHLILDSVQESEYTNTTKKLPLNLLVVAKKNQPIKIEYCLTYSINSQPKNLTGEIVGETCQSATTMPLTQNSAQDSFKKLAETNFCLNKFELQTDNVFITKKYLNELRRELIEKINCCFLKETKIKKENVNLKPKKATNIAKKSKNITLEISDGFASKCDFFVVKPKDYINFNYKKITHQNAFLYIPSFLPKKDLEIVENVLKNNKNLGVYAQNIGALNLSNKTILGAKLNIKNVFAVKQLLAQNVVLIEASPELSQKNFEILNNSFDVDMVQSNLNNFELMTFLHCPIKTIFKNNCSSCKYSDNLEYQMQNGKKFVLERYKIATCYFSLHAKR